VGIGMIIFVTFDVEKESPGKSYCYDIYHRKKEEKIVS
jgi:hypothetical protein